MFRKGYRETLETKIKRSKAISIAQKGRKLTEEWKENISIAMKGYHPVNEAKKGQYIGSNGLNWKGGRIKDKGYCKILKREHPFANPHGYVLEHRLVIEKHLGRYLKPEEVIHHNGTKYLMGSLKDRSDNHIENLILFKNDSEHMKFHRNITFRVIFLLNKSFNLISPNFQITAL